MRMEEKERTEDEMRKDYDSRPKVYPVFYTLIGGGRPMEGLAGVFSSEEKAEEMTRTIIDEFERRVFSDGITEADVKTRERRKGFYLFKAETEGGYLSRKTAACRVEWGEFALDYKPAFEITPVRRPPVSEETPEET